MSTAYPRRAWALAGFVLLLVVWLADMAHPTYSADGSWYLQITSRALDGDLPYRDFYLGTLPMPLWVNAAFTGILGTQIAVQKLLADAALVAGALLAARLALAIGASPAAAGLVLLASLAAAIMPTTTPYGPYSYLFLLATLAAVLAWGQSSGDPRRARLLVAAAGAMGGLSVSGKQTVGAAAMLALFACLVLWSPRERSDLRGRAADLAIAAGAASAVVALFLAPVAIGGGLGEFWRQAFEKGQYVESSGGSYLDGVRGFFEAIPEGDWLALRLNAVFLAPLAAAGALAWALARDRRPELLPLALFAAAAVLPALPRPFYFNVAFAVPACALLVAGAWRPRGVPRWAPAALATALALAFVLNMAREPIRTLDEGAAVAGLDHYQGSLFPDEMLADAQALNEDLRTADREGNVFILTPFSAFLYLVSGVESTTKHDYAARDSMRDEGEREVLEKLESGEIDRVCLGNYSLLPDQDLPLLEDWVRAHMRPTHPTVNPVRALPPWQCVVYGPR